jgi:hypothetical protein
MKRNNLLKKSLLWIFLFGILLIVFILWVTYSRYEGFDDNISQTFTTESQIPNIIWTFWEGNTPPFVNRCIQSWKDYNPNYKIIILNKDNIVNYLPDIKFSKMRAANDSPQRYSDYVRTHILAKYGGFWFDASIICQGSNTWIHDIQNKTGAEFIGYYLDQFTIPEYRKTSPVIESWCFACIPNSAFVEDWRDEFMTLNDYQNAKQYLEANSQVNVQNIDNPEYLVIHVSAQKLLQTNSEKYKLHLLRAEDTAYKHMVDDNGKWETGNAANRILEKRHTDQPLLKLNGSIREGVIDHCAKYNIDIEDLFIEPNNI